MEIISRIELLTKNSSIIWYNKPESGNVVGFWDKFKIKISNRWNASGDIHYFLIIIKNNRGIVIYRDEIFDDKFTSEAYNKVSSLLDAIDDKVGKVKREELGWFMGNERYI